jgi:hypothetical protein
MVIKTEPDWPVQPIQLGTGPVSGLISLENRLINKPENKSENRQNNIDPFLIFSCKHTAKSKRRRRR